mgnify:CR=1 FL=1
MHRTTTVRDTKRRKTLLRFIFAILHSFHIRVVKVPMTEIAAEHENPKGANIVMMGAMAANSDLFTEDDLERLINEFFEKKGKINPKNSLCFRAGTQIH